MIRWVLSPQRKNFIYNRCLNTSKHFLKGFSVGFVFDKLLSMIGCEGWVIVQKGGFLLGLFMFDRKGLFRIRSFVLCGMIRFLCFFQGISDFFKVFFLLFFNFFYCFFLVSWKEITRLDLPESTEKNNEDFWLFNDKSFSIYFDFWPLMCIMFHLSFLIDIALLNSNTSE